MFKDWWEALKSLSRATIFRWLSNGLLSRGIGMSQLNVRWWRWVLCRPCTVGATLRHLGTAWQGPGWKKRRGSSERRSARGEGVEVLTEWWMDCYRNHNKTYDSLTPMMRRYEIWFSAYQKVCYEVLGSFLPKPTFDRIAAFNLHNLMEAVLSADFVWGGYKRIFIYSPTEKEVLEELGSTRRKKFLLRNLSSPIFQDRIVQEVLLMVLEPIFEARFSPKSHGFRPGRSAHTALRTIRRSFPGYIWYLKVDLRQLLTGMKPGPMADAMWGAVRDKKVLNVIKSGIRTDPPPPLPVEKPQKKKYSKKKKLIQEGPKPDPFWLQSFFGFCPDDLQTLPDWGCCGVLSRLLLNIYLDQLDKWMEKSIHEFFQPSSMDSIWNNPDLLAQEGEATVQFVPFSGPEKTRRMEYIRYGTQFLVAIRGSHMDLVRFRSDLMAFCRDRLGLNEEMSLTDQMPIFHIKNGFTFLDHIISRKNVNPLVLQTMPNGTVVEKRVSGTMLSMGVSLRHCIVHLRKLGVLKGTVDAQPCFRLFHADQAFSNAQINKILLILSEWFKYADNRKKATIFCQYILRSSLAKLYAAKYKLRSRAKVYKIGSGDLSRPIKDKKGQSEHYKQMLRKGLVDEEIPAIEFRKISEVPDVELTPLPRNWLPENERLLREVAWMLRPGAFEEQLLKLRSSSTLSPQDLMSHIVWHFFHGVYQNNYLQASSEYNLGLNREGTATMENPEMEDDKEENESMEDANDRDELIQSIGS